MKTINNTLLIFLFSLMTIFGNAQCPANLGFEQTTPGTYVGAGNFSIPPGAKVIDAKGKHLTSGIIDEHSHIAIAKGVNEGGQAISAEVNISDVVTADDINIYRQ